MKRIFFSLAGILLLLTASAQDSTNKKKNAPVLPDAGKYCAIFTKGKMTVTTNGKPLKTDVELKNGNKITATGTIVKKDGSMLMMKNGECVNEDGNSVESAAGGN